MRRILSILFLLLLLSLSMAVLAHSGGTDHRGGHYDGDEYHYHHGYPAHDHYDIDGDGVPDCPYALPEPEPEPGEKKGITWEAVSSVVYPLLILFVCFPAVVAFFLSAVSERLAERLFMFALFLSPFAFLFLFLDNILIPLLR